MTDKELKKLSRSELLEILLDQAQEIELLNEQIDILKAKQKTKEIKLQEAGSIAEASLKLTEVFEEAQKAADIYLENAKTYSDDKMKAAKSMEDSRKMIYDAKAQADEILE